MTQYISSQYHCLNKNVGCFSIESFDNRIKPNTEKILCRLPNVRQGMFVEATETERLMEVRTLIARLTGSVNILGNTVSNSMPFTGALPQDKARLLAEFDRFSNMYDEDELRKYRDSIMSL